MSSSARHPRFPVQARHGLVGLFATAALGGCVSVPLPKLSTPLPSHWRNQPTNIGHDRQADLQSWWYRFDDKQLNALVSQSLRANLHVAEAIEHLRGAHALAAHSDAPYSPSIRFRTYHPVDPNANASFFVIGFDALWNLGLFGRRQGNLREVRGQLDTAAAQLRLVRVNVVAEVVRNWIALAAAQQRIAVLTRIHDARLQLVRLQLIRTRLGLAAPDQLGQSRAQAAEAQAALAKPREATNAAAQRIALLQGRSEPDNTWFKPHSLPRLHGGAITVIPAKLLDTRPQIALARAKVLQAAGTLGIAQADRYPSIGLGGSIIWSTSIIAHRGEPSNAIPSFGPTIDIPLLDWGLRKARATADSHALKASVLAYRQAVLHGVARVEIALGNLAQERDREQAEHTAWLALTNTATRQARRQNIGLSSHIASIRSALARDQAMLAVIDARQARDTAYAALYEALGGAPSLHDNASKNTTTPTSDYP